MNIMFWYFVIGLAISGFRIIISKIDGKSFNEHVDNTITEFEQSTGKKAPWWYRIALELTGVFTAWLLWPIVLVSIISEYFA